MSADCVCKNRFIGEGGKLTSDLLKISNFFNLRRYIVITDIEKAFASISHSFLLVCLQKFGFGHDFIRWVKILLENKNLELSVQELQRHTSIMDKVCAIVKFCIEVVLMFCFCLLKLFMKFEDYADDATFFLKNKNLLGN